MSTSKIIFFAGGAFIGIVVLFVSVSDNVWYSQERKGTVVDRTGKPISDAIVLVAWRATQPRSYSSYTFEIVETTSDKNGVFVVPAWGPRSAPFAFSSMTKGEPYIRVLATGYMPYSKSNTRGMEATEMRARDASPSPDGLNIHMEPMPVPIDQAALQRIDAEASFASIELTGGGGIACVWGIARKYFAKFSEIEMSAGRLQGAFAGRRNCAE